MDDLLLTPADAARLMGTRLRDARKRRGWTQAQLAEKSATSVPTVARLERTGQGQLHTFYAICAALGHLRDFEAMLRTPEPRTLEDLRRTRS